MKKLELGFYDVREIRPEWVKTLANVLEVEVPDLQFRLWEDLIEAANRFELAVGEVQLIWEEQFGLLPQSPTSHIQRKAQYTLLRCLVRQIQKVSQQDMNMVLQCLYDAEDRKEELADWFISVCQPRQSRSIIKWLLGREKEPLVRPRVTPSFRP